MYIRRVPCDKYDLFHHNIETHMQRQPLDVTYHFDLKVNDTLYRLHMLIANQRKLIPLQAVKMGSDGQDSELITDAIMLGALTELVVAEYSHS